jgi:hypothetical protein
LKVKGRMAGMIWGKSGLKEYIFPRKQLPEKSYSRGPETDN